MQLVYIWTGAVYSSVQKSWQKLRSNNANHFIQKFPISVDMKPAEIHS